MSRETHVRFYVGGWGEVLSATRQIIFVFAIPTFFGKRPATESHPFQWADQRNRRSINSTRRGQSGPRLNSLSGTEPEKSRGLHSLASAICNSAAAAAFK